MIRKTGTLEIKIQFETDAIRKNLGFHLIQYTLFSLFWNLYPITFLLKRSEMRYFSRLIYPIFNPHCKYVLTIET